MKRNIVLSCILLGLWSYQTYAQDTQSTLYNQVMEMDSLLFEVAFNQCNLQLYKEIMAEEMEFYDDRTGLNTSREKDILSFQDKCAKPYRVTRQLLETEIYPLGDFGAVQNGIHLFLVDGKAVESAKFTTIWEFTDQKWRVKRAISYDHKSIE
ncbi:MAG: nuclear transport factor 2 family protein [Bacteroidota bacterium]